MHKTFFVYITIDPKHGKLYLGRRYGYLDIEKDRYWGSSKAIQNIVRARTPLDLRRFVLQIYPDHASHVEGERQWGADLNVVGDDRFYNRTDCGHGGFIHLAHQKGEAHPLFGRETPDDTRRKIAAKLRGTKLTLETRQKQSLAHIGKPKPKGFGPTISALVKGAQNPMFGKTGALNPRSRKWLITSPDGEISAVFDLVRFCDERGLPYTTMVHCAASGSTPIRRGRAKGWVAAYEEGPPENIRPARSPKREGPHGNAGKKRTPEQRAAMSAARTGRQRGGKRDAGDLFD